MQQFLNAFVLLGALGVIPAFSFPSSAAEPARPTSGNLSSADRARVDIDVRADGTVWVRGRDYKASFCRAGATYIPFLGSDAPRNYPLGLSVERVLVAGIELAFQSDVPAIVDGASVVFDRGSFRERYLLTPDGIEQTFVFDDLPRRGEIEIEIATESELESSSDQHGFRFENERGHVRYGRAFTYDARNDEQPIESCLVDGSIALRVPSARVADAEFPLTVDPFLSTHTVRGTAIDEFAADTAYDASEGVFLTVFEEVFSAVDHDVRVVRHDAAGNSLIWQWIDSSAANWADPAVANVNNADQFLVVAAAGQAPNRDILGRTVGAGIALPISAVIEVSASVAIHDKHSPDIGGDPWFGGSANYCVVWQASYMNGDHDVRARMVNTAGGLEGAGPIGLSTLANEVETNPHISNSNGYTSDAGQAWNVVFEQEAGPGNQDLYGCRIDSAGAVTGPTNVAGTAADERNPSVSPGADLQNGTRPWLLTYQISTPANGWDVRARVMDELSVVESLDLPTLFPTSALHQTDPTCDTDGTNFVVAYTEQSSMAFGTTDIRLSTLFWTGSALHVSEGNVSVSPGLERDLHPRLAAKRSGGSSSDEILVVFEREAVGGSDVIATQYETPNGGPVEAFCFGDGTGMPCPCANIGGPGRGCASSVNPNGARLTASGNSSVGSDTFTLSADGLPTSAPVLFFQGTSQANMGNGVLFGDGLRCAAGVVTRLGTRMASGGAASYPSAFADVSISNRGNVAPGNTRYYQAHYRNSAAFCVAATFNLTNGLRVLWVP